MFNLYYMQKIEKILPLQEILNGLINSKEILEYIPTAHVITFAWHSSINKSAYLLSAYSEQQLRKIYLTIKK